jgi:ribosomal protein S18 acetylase RimI-like enzyme
VREIEMEIRPYLSDDEQAVIALWQKCNLVKIWNNPKLDIERKLGINPELFLVGLINGEVVATAMGGYEEHRGWVNYLAVTPDYQKKGIGRRIMEAIEQEILAKGCPKINVQIRSDNSDVVKFYESIGYEIEERISMGKRLTED